MWIKIGFFRVIGWFIRWCDEVFWDNLEIFENKCKNEKKFYFVIFGSWFIKKVFIIC